ncbi:hypothetical protein UO65_4707 [Actinokineospora spheciospongiae]|uniref:Uncharacterized protein n=1 Tax=Actinokineospora spheciospongiae TaxID=909613 RepID=W7II06_9PSEU|nr:hypothetical protein UO65_4707 [Actinokineospora spheciospongiae]
MIRRYRDEVARDRAAFPEYRVETRTVTRSAWSAAAASE